LNYPALLNITQEPELLHLANAFAALHTFGPSGSSPAATGN
jgi:hypothetical protein